MKHGLLPKPRQAIPAANLVMLLVSLVAVPFTWLGLIWPVLYGGLLAGTSLWVAVTRGSACGLYAGPALGIMHCAWATGFLGRLIRGRWDRP